ncbi:MAG: DUF4405 domain-containing protein [Rhodobacteraceae bacterium]|jgi:hypothetical protein|uniref:DUF4405 domain-containing protein n=1 Tax=Albidovulum sp. TaxID=1872424 RepID=UPI001E093134|nr:DUF4405 domain-containing protein [uncultured Defluviimonas sp.]MCB2127346.1 DUF4405 domain-containing protein [Paracoccaceae bacterium]MCC0069137.1 DUF4405 domain-containing protein [Paracoccaceae bacterium]
MPSLPNRYATPLITGLFLVSLVSGLALFFHVGPAAFHGMHEWLSMVLIVPFALHLWKNWRPMTAYLRRLPMALSLALSVAAAAVFFVPAGDARTGPPQFQLAQALYAATPELAAPVFGMTGAELVEGLRGAGLSGAEIGRTLREIAAASGKSDAELAVAIIGLSS